MLSSEESSLGNCKLICIVVTLLDLKTKLTSYIAHLNFYTRANILRFPKWLEFMGLSVSSLLTCARFWGKTINQDFAAISKPLVVDQPSLGTVNSPFLTLGNYRNEDQPYVCLRKNTNPFSSLFTVAWKQA